MVEHHELLLPSAFRTFDLKEKHMLETQQDKALRASPHGELVHRVYRCHVYPCHCSDSHLPEQLFTHGHDNIGPGLDKILYVSQCKKVVDLHSGQGWKCSFLFQFH